MTQWMTHLGPAMAAPAGQGAQQQQSPVFMIGWLVLMIGLFYFLMIRPQQRKEKQRRAMIDNIKSGDKVVFGGGILGVVSNVKDRTFMVKVADNVKLEVSRTAVTQVLADKDADIQDESKS